MRDLDIGTQALGPEPVLHPAGLERPAPIEQPLRPAAYRALARCEYPMDRLVDDLTPWLAAGRRGSVDPRVADAEILACLYKVPGAPVLPTDPAQVSPAHAAACGRVLERLEQAQHPDASDA